MSQVLDGVHASEETAAVPEFYKSPPYLTCKPQVVHHRLTPKDKFLVIGSDGLWDMMTPMQVRMTSTSNDRSINNKSYPRSSGWWASTCPARRRSPR